jgi:hypothetical protein
MKIHAESEEVVGSCWWPNGEHPGEEVGEDAERDEPHAHEHEDVAAPPLDGGTPRPDPLGHALLRQGHGERCCEGQQDDRARRHGVGDEGGPEPARRERLSRQTGEDRPRSPEADDQVGEPEGGETGDRMFAPEPRLPLGERLRQTLGRVEGHGKDLGLDQP